MSQLILPLCYLAPVSWYASMLNHGTNEILIEQYEHYSKQTYRNRCYVYSPNGKLALSIPVQKSSGEHTAYKDIRISYDENWQRIHWMTLETCYRSSAFFEFYEHELAPFYKKRVEFLFDFNAELLETTLKWLKETIPYCFTSDYEKSYRDAVDLRDTIHPKKENKQILFSPYYQVFEEKHGFIRDLSIVDLLFNMGPGARKKLEK